MNISEIPTLTFQQKKQFWQLGRDLWHMTSLELYENMARNVAVVLRHHSHRLRGKTVTIHWAVEYPFRLLMALLRHLILLDVFIRVQWYGTPPGMWKTIAHLIEVKKVEHTHGENEGFPLLFIDEQTFIQKMIPSSQPAQPGLLTVLPHASTPEAIIQKVDYSCFTTLIFDFPTFEFLEFKSAQPTLRAFLGNTGIPVQLVKQLGVETKSIYAGQSVIDLSYPNSDWHGSHCSGIYLG